MSYVCPCVGTVHSVRQRPRRRAAGLVLKRSWKARMLEEFGVQEDCVPREQDGSYNSSRMTPEVWGQIHWAKIITSWRFPSLVSWLLLLFLCERSVLSWNFNLRRVWERKEWVELFPLVFLTLEDSWIIRIDPVLTTINRIVFKSYFLTNPCPSL